MARKTNTQIVVRSADYSADVLDDVVEMSAVGGARTVTLPSPSQWPGNSFTVVKTDSTANTVTVAVVGSNTINGVSTYVIARQHQSVSFQSDGASSYRVIAGGASVPTAAVVLTPGAVVSIDPTLGDNFSLTPAQAETINAASVGAFGQDMYLFILTSGAVSYVLTFGTNFLSAGTLTTGTVTAKRFVVRFRSNGTSWLELFRTAAL